MTAPLEPPALPIKLTPAQEALEEKLARHAWIHEARVAMTRVALRDVGIVPPIRSPALTRVEKFLLACEMLDGFSLASINLYDNLLGVADGCRHLAAVELFELLAKDLGPLEGDVACACAGGCTFCEGRPVAPDLRRLAQALVVYWAVLPAEPDDRRALLPAWVGEIVTPHLLTQGRVAVAGLN